MTSLKENKKSLFIIAVPRSASTVLEKICSAILDFRPHGEILNAGHNKNIKVPQYATKLEHFEAMKAECLKYPHNMAVRDVIQIHFVTQNIDWLLERFNIIHIIRPVDEIMVSRRRLGWKMPRKTVLKHQDMLCEISEQDGFHHLDYYDFVRDTPNKIVGMLQDWYGCRDFEYMDHDFTFKQGRTAKELKAHHVLVPQKKI